MSANKIPRGRPAFVETQCDEVRDALVAAGKDGVSRATCIFEMHITQVGARVDELKRMGYAIHSESRESERYVRYVLDGDPVELRPLQQGADWYEARFGPRPSEKPPKEDVDDLPLFAAGRR